MNKCNKYKIALSKTYSNLFYMHKNWHSVKSLILNGWSNVISFQDDTWPNKRTNGRTLRNSNYTQKELFSAGGFPSEFCDLITES